VVVQPRANGLDEAVGKRLWTVSEELTGAFMRIYLPNMLFRTYSRIIYGNPISIRSRIHV
jgi:hypothetical protein